MVELPREHTERPSDERSVDSPSATNPRTVLLVEDEQPVRDVVRWMLEGAGHRVVEAESAEDALNQFNAIESVDLLVSDIVMPGMCGVELSHILVERSPLLRVLFMSGSDADADLELAVARKDVAFLKKPFSTDTLATKVRETLS